MAISEKEALALLQELLKRPDLSDVARIYRELLEVHTHYFPAVLVAASSAVAEPLQAAAAAALSDAVAELPVSGISQPAPVQVLPSEERSASGRRKKPNTVHGWPKGVTQKEFYEWKAQKLKEGYTGALHPAVYKALRDGEPVPNVAPPRAQRKREMAQARAKLAAVKEQLHTAPPPAPRRTPVETARDRRARGTDYEEGSDVTITEVTSAADKKRGVSVFKLAKPEPAAPAPYVPSWEAEPPAPEPKQYIAPKVEPEVENFVRRGDVVEQKLTL